MSIYLCSQDSCSRPISARGLCSPHYERMRKGSTAEQLAAPIGQPRTKGTTTCRHPDRKHYGHGLCAPCYQTIHNKDWRARNARKLAMGGRARKHGMTPAELEELYAAQQGECANPGCDARFDLFHDDHRNGLQIDHDHATGQVRGLLCKQCNSALGHAKDDLRRLEGLVEYLKARMVSHARA